MARKRARRTTDAELDMTPMIDIVFQLIIFFIITIKLEQEYCEDIELEDAKHGPEIDDLDSRTVEIEVDRRGWIYIHGAALSKQKLQAIMKRKYDKFGSNVPVLIRADKKAQHKDVRAVMDICTGVGIWRVSFAAIKEDKT
jgi:biopolymer transport protein ExbD